MKTELILIANASEARLLSRDAMTATLNTLDSVHRAANGATPGEPQRVPVNVGRPLDPKHRRMRDFAAIVARRVEAELAGGHFSAVALFAACPFLGELMRQFDRTTKETLRRVVDADISDLDWSKAAQRIELELHAAAQAEGRPGRRGKPRAT
ncbi:host attachment protein [Azohydromonas australica]|uniref:host attachment protein n=1 Tax=Azohydromonas australica TaxID=364039 RepID=UPI00040C3283|nr:host attachment protein [Azohydromonas australica]